MVFRQEEGLGTLDSVWGDDSRSGFDGDVDGCLQGVLSFAFL